MIVAAGLGCRKGAQADDIVALISRALVEASLPVGKLTGLFAPAFKYHEGGLIEAARRLDVPIVFIPDDAMRATAPHGVTNSERVFAMAGVGCIAEAAALAGAGWGARLVLPRIACSTATCAVAVTGPLS